MWRAEKEQHGLAFIAVQLLGVTVLVGEAEVGSAGAACEAVPRYSFGGAEIHDAQLAVEEQYQHAKRDYE
jgi:hypothetical protein